MVEKHVDTTSFYGVLLLFYPHWRWGYTLLCLEVSRNKAIAVKIVVPVHQAGHLGMFVARKNSDILDWFDKFDTKISSPMIFRCFIHY